MDHMLEEKICLTWHDFQHRHCGSMGPVPVLHCTILRKLEMVLERFTRMFLGTGGLRIEGEAVTFLPGAIEGVTWCKLQKHEGCTYGK